jgi:basic membrane protein A
MRRILAAMGICSLFMVFVISPVKAGTVASHQAAGAFTVGLVTDIGGLNDKSFNHLAYVGLQEAGRSYHIRGFVIESKSPSDYVPNLTNFAQRHMGLTIAVGFLMENAIYQVAKEYPTQKFAIIDGAPADAKGNTVNLGNVANLFFKEQESGYLVGVIAGLMEKNRVGAATHNAIGVMGGLSIPSVNRYIAGYYAGARKVDPGIRVFLGYSQSFTNQAAAKSIGLAQIGQGADILFQVAGGAGLGYLAAAQQRGKYGIGVDSDQGFLGRFVLTSALKKVNAAVSLTVRDTMRGRFHGGDHLFTLRNNSTGFAPTSPLVPKSIVAQATAYEKLIKSGKIVPPTTIPSH